MYRCTCYYSPDFKTNITDCQYKNLTYLPKNVLPYTEQLLMSGNNIGNINRVEKYMQNIIYLDLNKSRVSSVSDDAMILMLQNLKTLNLANNILEILPRSITKAKNDTKLWISNNSYDCNCDMMWMRDWLVKVTNVVDKEQVVCRSGKMIGRYSGVIF